MLNAGRINGIGGSELAAILGLDQYKTALDVWMDKTGRREPFQGNEATWRGHVLEDAVGKYMERELGEDWVRLPDEFYVHYDYPYVVGHPDRLYYNRLTGERKGGELKTTLERIEPDDITDLDNPKKLPWLFQCQWYMILTGCPTWELGWMGAFFQYHQVTVKYDQTLANYLIKFVGEWWEKHIVQDIQPEPVNAADALIVWPKDDGTTFEANETLAEAVQDYAHAKRQAKAWSEKADVLADRIKLAFGGCSEVTINGERAATYKANKAGVKSLRCII